TGKEIGKVGATGNAAGKPPHLHYAVISLLPYPWKIEGAIEGWKKMFYLNPSELIRD
ncbi:MAG TPA: M23 family peptidase, partial [Pseudomonadales bacterium]|nr:M23 family peptidase [Pseudomonadales bacterium]